MLKWIPVSPLGRRLIIALVLISLVVSTATSALAIWNSYHEGIQRYNTILKQVAQNYQESLANSLWSYDLLQIDALTQGILNFPSIIYVQIDTDSEILTQHGDMYLRADKKLSLPLIYNEQTIGNLRISQSYDNLYQSLYDQAIVIVTSLVFLTISIALMILYVFHRLVTRRLHKMALWANSFTLGRLDNELTVDNLYLNDELSQVSIAINQMRLTLKEDLRIREQEHEAHSRLQNQLSLAVENAELGICRYTVSKQLFDCNHHFAKQIGLSKGEVEFLSDPMAYIEDSIFGENSCSQKEQIQQLMSGQKTLLHDRYILNSPQNFSVLDISFQVVGYIDNKPEHILICSTNRTNEFNLNNQVQNCEQEHSQQNAELEASYQRKLKRINDEKISLKRESRRLKIGQQPKHIQFLTQLMSLELGKCQDIIGESSYALWQKFLSLDFYKKLEPIDLSKDFSKRSKELINQYNSQIDFTEDLPLTLIAEEDPIVFSFLVELLLHPDTLINAQSLHLFVRLIHNDLHVSWSFHGAFDELTEAQQLAFKMANLIAQMRYNGKFEHKKSGDQFILSITAPFRT